MLKAQLGDQVSQSLLQDLNEVFVRGLRSEVEYKRDDVAVQKYLEGLVGDSTPQMTTRLPPLVVRRRVDDTESPVSAMLKLNPMSTGLVLFESVVGGETRGRYSFIGTAPDLWWRVRDGKAETSLTSDFSEVLSTETDVMGSLRGFIDACKVDGMDGLPPMAAGAFGYLGYDMVRHVEKLPEPKPDPNGVPEAMLMRPGVVLIFDGVQQEIILAAPARKDAQRPRTRLLDRIEAVLDQPMPPSRPSEAPVEKIDFASNTTKARYLEMVEKAKSYIHAGDIFQVVPSQRFSAPFERSPFAFYRALRRLNPSPFMFYVNFGDFQISGSSPEILVRVRNGVVTVRPIAGTLPRGATPEAGQGERTEADLRSQGARRAPHAARSRPQRCRPRRRARHGGGDARASPSSATATSCTSSPTCRAS